MIIGLTINSNKTFDAITTAISGMHQSFFLTGSHFFGNAKEHSDYDFFVSKSAGVQKALKALGFEEIKSENMIDKGYDGNQFVSILQILTSDSITIQVQVVENVGAKKRVQEQIKDKYLTEFNSMSKEERKKLWSFLLNLVD